jgi:hypothetical protein
VWSRPIASLPTKATKTSMGDSPLHSSYSGEMSPSAPTINHTAISRKCHRVGLNPARWSHTLVGGGNLSRRGPVAPAGGLIRAFSPRPGRCFRMVYSRQLLATHWDERPAWNDWPHFVGSVRQPVTGTWSVDEPCYLGALRRLAAFCRPIRAIANNSAPPKATQRMTSPTPVGEGE